MLGVAINGRLIAYYLLFFSSLALFLLMLRIVNSPFGRVLQAIRENDFRAEAIGYRTVALSLHRQLRLRMHGDARGRPAARSGCATPARRPRCPSTSCSTSSSWW